MVVIRARFWVLMSTAVLLSSCGGSDPAPPNNFSAEAVKVITQDPRIGHPLQVSVQLKANQPADNVSVALFAIDDTSDPDADVRQIPLGTELIEQLPAGSSEHVLNLAIPSSVEFAGPYYIGAIVDPVDEVVELDEEDNTSETGVELGPVTDPNLVLADVALDRTALIINTDEYLDEVGVGNVYNADAGGTITLGADGLDVDETVDIEAFASLRIIRKDNGTSHEVPLYLWNSEEQRYINAYGVDPDTGVMGEVEWLPMGTFTPQLAEIIGDEAELDDVTRNSEHMDFYFPGKLGYELEQALRYPPAPCTPPCVFSFPLPTIPPPDLTAAAIDDLKAFLSGLPFSGVRGDESVSLAALDFAVCVKVRPTDPMVSDSIAEDNEVCPALDIFLPPLPPGTPLYETGSYVPVYSKPSEPLSSGDGFATKNNNKHFAFNIDFGAGATADYRGYIEEVTAGLPVRLFGIGFDFMRITGRAQLVPDYLGKPASEKSGFSYEIRFLNQVIDSLAPTTISVSIPIEGIGYSKEIEKEQQFFVGPVPMIAGGSIGGSIGIEYTFGYGGDDPSLFGSGASANPVISVGSSIGPKASLEALMFAGVGTKVFSVGVEGVVTLLEEKLVYFIGTEIEVIDDGFTSGDVEFMVTQLQKLSNIFTGPVGKLNLFAKYTVPKVKTCKWKFIKFKCIKLGTIKATKNIYTTPALFRREDILFEDPFAELDVVIVNGLPPAYFIP